MWHIAPETSAPELQKNEQKQNIRCNIYAAQLVGIHNRE
jgi:hypothetical protein